MSNFFARLLNDSSSSNKEERNNWFSAAIEFEIKGNGSLDQRSRHHPGSES